MKNKQVLLLSAAILLSVFVNIQLYRDVYTHSLIILWLCSLLLIIFSSFSFPLGILKKNLFSWKKLIIFLVIILPVLARILNYVPTRIHGDDLLTAYFSAHYDFGAINFFSMIPQVRTDWVSQFPTIYFAFQKLFFMLLGESVLTVKLSAVPYIFIVSLMIFLIVRRIFSVKTAIISIIIYSFFSPSLYLETLGLHFISSTAMFLIFFYFLILSMKEKKIIYPLLTGVFCAFSYLFYTSSYIALPVLILIYFILFIMQKRLIIFRNFLLSILSFLIIISPFITYAYKHTNYFSQRIKQVSLLNGEWSGAKDRIRQGESPIKIVSENLTLSLKSLYTNGIGGHGGYDFNHLAFFNQISLLLFLMGTLAETIAAIKQKRVEIFYIFGIIVLSFFTSMVFTIPPPAYHRFSIAFPFLVIIMTLPFNALIEATRIPIKLRLFLVLIGLSIYFVSNQLYFAKASGEKHGGKDSLRLAQYIQEKFPGRNIYVASFPNFAFEKILYFEIKDKSKNVRTKYHANLLAGFNKDEKYVYVITLPNIFNSQFKSKDANGNIINYSQDYSLFVN